MAIEDDLAAMTAERDDLLRHVDALQRSYDRAVQQRDVALARRDAYHLEIPKIKNAKDLQDAKDAADRAEANGASAAQALDPGDGSRIR